MSGIAGIVRWRSGEEVAAQQIENMVRSLAHRGRDSQGSLCEAGVALGAARLAIQDLSAAGRQPMSSDDGDITVLFDGELHDHQDLRALLVGSGQVFRGTSDTETLVHGYRRLGLDRVLRAINGVFAFAVLDRRRQKLVLVRDSLGVKPLYLRRGPGQITFASEIRALANDGLGRPSADPAFVGPYLHLGWVPSPHTAFAGVTKLDPGTVLEIDLNSGTEERRTFYRLSPEALPGGADDESVLDTIRERLNWVIRRQLLSDVPIGVLLTGGLESSALLAIARSHLDRSPASFSWRFKRSPDLEDATEPERVAQELGSPHTALALGGATLEELASIVKALEEPFADIDVVPAWHLYRGAAAHVRVAMSDEGARALLGGAWDAAGPAGPSQQELFSTEERTRLAGATVDRVTPALQQLDAAARALGLDATQRERMAALSPMFLDGPMLKADKLSMAHGLEVRVPFLDRKLIEIALALPATPSPVGVWGRKPLLQRLLAERLPRSITRRTQQSLPFPAGRWLRQVGGARLRERLLSGALVRKLGFSAAAIESLGSWQDPREDLGRRWFALAFLELWAEEHC